jgi:hypothetical protein
LFLNSDITFDITTKERDHHEQEKPSPAQDQARQETRAREEADQAQVKDGKGSRRERLGEP